MARKRMIDPAIWQSQDFGNLSTLAKLVFIGLFSQADDEGRGRAKPQYIRNTLFPYDEIITREDVENSFREISKFMSIIFYEENGNEYYALTNWSTWQKVDKRQPSNFPTPPEHSTMYRELIGNCSTNDQESFDERSLLIEQNRKENNKTEKNTYVPSPLTSLDPKPKSEDRYTTPFEEFWNTYPRKDDKGQAYKKYQARLKDGYSDEELLQAAKAYAEKCKREKTEQKYIKLAKTFLGDSTPFTDFLSPTAVQKQERGDPFAEAEREWEEARINRGDG